MLLYFVLALMTTHPALILNEETKGAISKVAIGGNKGAQNLSSCSSIS